MVRRWRTAGGAAHREKDEPVLTLAFKDIGASEPGLDIAAGLMEADESINLLQIGEAVEEIAYIDPESIDGEATVYAPDIIEGTPMEDRFTSFYERASELSDGIVPEDYEIEFVDSEMRPLSEEVLDSTEEFGSKVTGAVHQPPVTDEDKWSRELIEYLEVDVPDHAVPLDLEIVEDGEESFYLNRIDFRTNVETGYTEVWREGEVLYSGEFDEALGYVEQEVDDRGYNVENLGEDQKNPFEDPFNVKSGAAITGMEGVEVHESIRQYLE